MADLVCTDPLHATRSAQSGWQTVLGTTDTPGTPATCPACLAANLATVRATNTSLNSYQQAAQQAITTLENAVNNWATLTAPQKDGATKLVCNVVAKLARFILKATS